LKNKIYIYGASGHGLVVANIAKGIGYDEIIYIDDSNDDYASFNDIKANNHIPLALGIGKNIIRKKIFDKASRYNFKIETLIHPTSVIGEDVKIGIGTIIMPNVVINASSQIGIGVILNSSSVIEHENIIGDFVHISPNVSLAGNVSVGDLTHIGIGSAVIPGTNIGYNCIIGAGSVVLKDIHNNKVAVGIPSKAIKDKDE